MMECHLCFNISVKYLITLTIKLLIGLSADYFVFIDSNIAINACRVIGRRNGDDMNLSLLVKSAF